MNNQQAQLRTFIFRISDELQKRVSLAEAYTRTIFYQPLLTVSYLVYSPLSLVVWNDIVAFSDYAVLNIGMRIEAMIIGRASVNSTAIWNRYNADYSMYDSLALKYKLYLALTSLFAAGALSFYFLGYDVKWAVLQTWLSIATLTIYSLFASKYLMRAKLNKNL